MDEIDAMGDDVTMVVSVQGWLESIGLQEYWSKFESAGYDDLDTVSDMSEAELGTDLGVDKVGHVKKLAKEIKKLKTTRRASSVSDLASPMPTKNPIAPGSKPSRQRKGSVEMEIEAMNDSSVALSLGDSEEGGPKKKGRRTSVEAMPDMDDDGELDAVRPETHPTRFFFPFGFRLSSKVPNRARRARRLLTARGVAIADPYGAPGHRGGQPEGRRCRPAINQCWSAGRGRRYSGGT
jgi:hypothetical protein